MPKGGDKPLENVARLVPVKDLREYPGNARRGDVEYIADSLERNTQYRPIVVNTGGKKSKGTVLAGNHTLQAAHHLGWERIRVWYVHVDDETARRINLVDNKAPERGGYDDEALADLLRPIGDDPEALAGTGWEPAEVSGLLEGTAAPEAPLGTPDPPDDAGGAGDQYGVIVVCRDEAHQEKVYEDLKAAGHDCRVVVV